MTPAAQGGLETLHLGTPAMGRDDVFPGHDTIGMGHPAGAIDIVQEEVDGLEALDQAPLQPLPFPVADQTGQGIQGRILSTPLLPESLRRKVAPRRLSSMPAAV